eukprot:TRINITY_DN2796_c0_g1_i1.p1 TRINITY_DN2796_c0_g1~~TRINITY_DN2796_c0_g1_i1.p1  ORF type:complete len:417 (-),score=71.89 TRINITY_DN2796_c0_g1_i1:542-1792(-)
MASVASTFISAGTSQCNGQRKFPSPASHGKLVGSAQCVDVKPKTASFKGLQSSSTKINALKVNGVVPETVKSNVCVKDTVEEESVGKSRINMLPDWSMLLAALATIMLAAEKQWTNFDWRPRKTEMSDMFGEVIKLGRFVEDTLVFRQNFAIRSYEVGADKTASIETLMNHLQETALNHVRRSGLYGDGFGATLEMNRRGLIWVVARMQVQVERYPAWGDIVEIDTWVGASGKNGMRRDWLVRDSKTQQVLTRATSTWVMMNRNTRKLSKIPDAVRAEIQPFFNPRTVFKNEDTRKLRRLEDGNAEYTCSDLTPHWSDLDVNQHVNNVKYIGWILESLPLAILEKNELANIVLEYRRECGPSNVLQSLTSHLSEHVDDEGSLEFAHVLRLQNDGAEILRAVTEWRAKANRNVVAFA